MKTFLLSLTLILPALLAEAQNKTNMADSATQHSLDIVNRFFEAQGANDTEKMAALMTDDVQWRVAGNPALPWIGDHQGKQNVLDFLKVFGENLQAQSFAIDTMVAQGANVMVLANNSFRVKGTNQYFSGPIVIHFAVRGDQVSKHNVYENSYDVSEAYLQRKASPDPKFTDSTRHVPRQATLPLISAREASGQVKERLSSVPTQLNVFKATAIAPGTFPAIMDLTGAVLTTLSLDSTLRELSILHTAEYSSAEYEWVQHVPLARQAGVTQAQIDDLVRGKISGDSFDARETLVLRATDELLRFSKLPDATLAELKAEFSPREIMELVVTTGTYMMMSRIMRTANVPIDEAIDTSWANKN